MSQITSVGAGSSSMGTVISLTGNAGGAVNPDGAGNIDILGSGGITVTGNPGAYNLVISTSGMATEYDTDSGNAVPAAGVLNVLGGTNIATSGAGSTVTVNFDGTLVNSLAGNSGGALTGALNLVTANTNVDFVGAGTTITQDFASSTNLLIGDSGSITSGLRNTAFGVTALSSLAGQQQNTAIGYGALTAAGGGGADSNTAIGVYSCHRVGIGGQNTACGYGTIQNITSGTFNIALGYNAGSAHTAGNSRNINIGSFGVAGQSNITRIGYIASGTSSSQNQTYIDGITGVTPSGTYSTTVINTSGQLGSSSSITYNSDGSLNYPLQPAFLAVKDVAQNNATGNAASVTVSYSNEIFDQNNDYDGTDTFTAPVTGRYYFSANVGYTSVVGTSGYINIVSSNRTFQGFLVNPTAIDNGSNSLVLNFSTLIDMDASDTCTIETTFSGGGGNTVDLPALTTIMFSGYLVC